MSGKVSLPCGEKGYEFDFLGGGVSKLRKHQFLNDKNKVQVEKKVYCSRKTIKMTF